MRHSGVPLRAAVYAKGATTPVLELTANERLVRPGRGGPSRSRLPPARRSWTSASSARRATTRRGRPDDRARRRPGRVGFPLAAPAVSPACRAATSGLSAADGRRPLRRGPRRDRRRRARGRRDAAATGCASLPTVSLDGVTAHELATPLGTVLGWQLGRRLAHARRLGHGDDGRGSGARARDERAAPVVARGLFKRYGEIVAVDGVDLTVEPGDVFGYLGPNGAGKTTSLRMLLGLIRPTSGSARLFGLDPMIDGARALEGVAGFVEGPRFYPYLSGRQNLGCSPTTTGTARERGSRRRSSSSSCATGRRTASAATRTGCGSGSASPPR